MLSREWPHRISRNRIDFRFDILQESTRFFISRLIFLLVVRKNTQQALTVLLSVLRRNFNQPMVGF